MPIVNRDIERQIVQGGIDRGWDEAKIKEAVIKYRENPSAIGGSQPQQTPTPQPAAPSLLDQYNQNKKPNIGQQLLQTVAKPAIKTLATGAAAAEGLARTAAALPGGVSQEELNKINQATTRERDFGVLGSSRPVSVQEDGGMATPGQFARDVIGTGLELGSYLTPGAVVKGGVAAAQGAKAAAKPLISAVARGTGTAGAVGSGIGSLGSALADKTANVGDIIGRTALGTIIGGVTGGTLGAGSAAIGRGASQLANKATQTAQNLIPSNTSNFVKGVSRSIGETVGNIGSNIQKGSQRIAEQANLPEVERKLLATGLPEGPIFQLKNAGAETAQKVKEVVDIAKQRLTTNTGNLVDVQGRAVLDRIAKVVDARKAIGKEMEEVVERIGGNTYDARAIRQEIRDVLKNATRLPIPLRTAVNKILKEIPENATTLSAKELADINSRLASSARTISQMKNITSSDLDVVVGQIRKVITQRLPDEYRVLSQQYAEVMRVINDLLKEMGATKKNGAFYTIDDFLESGDTLAGEKLIRLLSNVSGSRQLIYGQLEELAKRYGYTGTDDLNALVEWTNLIESALNIPKPGSFQGRITQAGENVADIAAGAQVGGLPGSIVGGALGKAKKAMQADKAEAIEEFIKSLLRTSDEGLPSTGD